MRTVPTQYSPLPQNRPFAEQRRLDIELVESRHVAAIVDATLMKVLLNSLGDEEAVVFADAMHPTHEVRPAGCWAPKDQKVVLEQTSGRQRLNIHGAIDLETGKTRMIEVTTV